MNLLKKYAIGRYYFNSLFRQQAEKSFVTDLMKEPFITERSSEYAIGNIQTEVSGEYTLLRGTFGRMRKGTIGKTYDKVKKEFKQEVLPEIADAVLEFIIDLKSHLIYVEHSSLVKPSYFADKFKKIYANTASIADFGIDFIFVEQDVYETIKKWKSVDRVLFKKLRPSKPRSLDDYKDIEDLLKETKSEKTNIEFQAPVTKDEKNAQSTSLNYESKLIKQGIALSAHGYGEAKIKGKEGERDVEVESKKFLKKVEIDFGADGAIEKIIQTSEEINQQEKHE